MVKDIGELRARSVSCRLKGGLDMLKDIGEFSDSSKQDSSCYV
jgi:hypothetical protein